MELVAAPNPVSPNAEGFVEKITPQEPGENLFLFKCPTKHEDGKVCGHVHYRHAGYVKVMLPYLKPGNVKEMIVDNHSVMVCVLCKHCYVWAGGQMYDVTKHIDLTAWEKLEKEMYRATGPGGDC